jgi:hypothetical protein
MKRLSMLAAAVLFAFVTTAADAQVIPPGGSRFNPPLPAPLPPPKIQAPVVPQLDAPMQYNYVPSSPPPSFGDRILRCLDDAAAAGLRPAARSAYSRACANRN